MISLICDKSYAIVGCSTDSLNSWTDSASVAASAVSSAGESAVTSGNDVPHAHWCT